LPNYFGHLLDSATPLAKIFLFPPSLLLSIFCLHPFSSTPFSTITLCSFPFSSHRFQLSIIINHNHHHHHLLLLLYHHVPRCVSTCSSPCSEHKNGYSLSQPMNWIRLGLSFFIVSSLDGWDGLGPIFVPEIDALNQKISEYNCYITTGQ